MQQLFPTSIGPLNPSPFAAFLKIWYLHANHCSWEFSYLRLRLHPWCRQQPAGTKRRKPRLAHSIQAASWGRMATNIPRLPSRMGNTCRWILTWTPSSTETLSQKQKHRTSGPRLPKTNRLPDATMKMTLKMGANSAGYATITLSKIRGG